MGRELKCEGVHTLKREENASGGVGLVAPPMWETHAGQADIRSWRPQQLCPVGPLMLPRGGRSIAGTGMRRGEAALKPADNTQPEEIRYKLVQQTRALGQQTEPAGSLAQHFQTAGQAEVMSGSPTATGEHHTGLLWAPTSSGFQEACYL